MMNNYPVIMADPPWAFLSWSAKGQARGPEAHYRTMTTDDLCKLPIPASEDAVLFLWAVWPRLPDALRVIDAWGFEYKSLAWVWAKLNRNSMGFFMGMGYSTRANTEPCLFATRGKPHRPAARDVQALIVSPIREHSRKPDEQYAKIERLYEGPYLEMFARRTRAGWSSWGNEVESDIQIATTVTVIDS